MPARALPDTPVMRQYRELKDAHPEAVLFFRLGDFYEMFGEDARLGAPLLGLVLTSRQDVPMCGVPCHQLNHYASKLLRAGRKVAIAEQLEEPTPAKKLVRRGIVRVMTPGTVIEDDLLEPTAANYLACVEHDVVGWGAAFIDVSTGDFWATQALNDRGCRKLLDLLARLRPAEVLASERSASALGLPQTLAGRCCLTLYEGGQQPEPPAWLLEPAWANHRLAARAALSCRRYVAEAKFHLRELLSPTYRETSGQMQLDETAIRTLELVEASSGNRRHTLWGLLDRCRTPMGSRTLKRWILQPSTELAQIVLRQNCVEDLLDRSQARAELGGLLRGFADLPRVVSRLATRQAGPRDLAALRASLAALPPLHSWLSQAKLSTGLSELALRLAESAQPLADCRHALDAALADEVPARLSDGRLIRDGYDARLDALRLLRGDSQGVLAKLEAQERQATGIPSLKAGYNSVFGYYFEITKVHGAKVPARYARKQTLTNAERYITPELKELENSILGAEEKISRLEARLFEDLREAALRHHDALLAAAERIAELDCLNALAEVADAHGFVKPVVDLSHELQIVEGRHPVVAALLPAGSFVANSLELDARARQILVLTGPNMSGKSTFLRQNALIALLAQIGSFVPAKSARIGLVDRILTRIGAQDALAQGESTFMVEMKETSHILRSATPRSLLILDEVGRGTSTFDGISIAWAVVEHLHSERGAAEGPRGPRVLFATHYFELTELAKSLEGVVNANVEAREWTREDGSTEVVFLHKISEGPADRSYGIHVAALAGLPPELIARAREILSGLERRSAADGLGGRQAAPAPELPLFEEHPVLQALRLLDCDALSPLEALQALTGLKKKL
ncbi:MAG: DNA mismatch repair protein MutS [Elusimicrobia bacterium]|nr:DNA mismatch repair protein MutS [Elusimicrobiota bacterium]MDE2424310.1 DNA mismatch repair protein MutS [Elusimicrobiota bacterium]